MSGFRATAREFAHRFGWNLIMLVGVPTAVVGAVTMFLAPTVAVVSLNHLGVIHVAEDDWIVLAALIVAQLVWMAAGMALVDTYDESSDRLGVRP